MSNGFLLGVFACDDDSASEAVARNKGTFDLAVIVGVNEEVVSHGVLRLNVDTLYHG